MFCQQLRVEAWELYVALSRITPRKELKVVITGDEGEDSNTIEFIVVNNESL